jgi:hypothetical protein
MGEAWANPEPIPPGLVVGARLPFLPEQSARPAARLNQLLATCLALLFRDYAPGEAAENLSKYINPHDYETHHLLTGAHSLFSAAAHLNQLEDLQPSIELIQLAKKALREVAVSLAEPGLIETLEEKLGGQ